jgi:hypothetical protein
MAGERWFHAYTYAEAGRIAGLSRQRIHQLVASGELGTVLRFGRRYVSGSSLYAWMLARSEASGRKRENGGSPD